MRANRFLSRVRGPAIPLARTAELRPIARRTLFVRVALAAGMIACVGAAAAAGRTVDTPAHELRIGHGGVILVLDVSKSIRPIANQAITRVATELMNAHARVGLVAFSDIAYELLPPGSPARELKPLLRFFKPPPPGHEPPLTPWSIGFSAGTQISAGLRFAQNLIRRSGDRKTTILLLSDLDTAPDDVPRVAQTFNQFRHDGVRFRIISLSPQPADASLFQNLAGKSAFVQPLAHTAGGSETDTAFGGATPWVLVTFAALLLIGLGLNEHWCGRLHVPRWRA